MKLRAALIWPVLGFVLNSYSQAAFAEENAKQGQSSAKSRVEAPPSHKTGPRPRVPKADLPEGVPLPEANLRARHSIAEGATPEELKKGAEDEELEALREAERVLFPQNVRGIQSGWSFELPIASDEKERTLGLSYVSPQENSLPGVAAEDLNWLRSLTMPDLPVRLDRRVVTYLKFYRDSPRGRTIAAIWTRKSGRYVAEMKAQLRRAGLPTDLVWLSMIESGHNPTIQSPAGAMGLWQFMPESGRMYGLTVDRWVDERRDPARATQAAIRFLGDLYQRFGNWELSMAAYNMGYAGMSRAIAKYSSNDYWALSRMESGIPWETSLYVPKIFALAVVMNNRQAFGVGNTKLDPSVSFDTIMLEPATPLPEVAKAAGISLSELQELNPQYLSTKLPPTAPSADKLWKVHVPHGKGEQSLAKVSSQGGKKRETYRARLGDTVEQIAEDYRISESALLRENGLDRSDSLSPGTVLLLPTGAKFQPAAASGAIVVSRPLSSVANQRRVFYHVQSGDSLALIAQAFSVTESDISRWNLLNEHAHLREGMTLQLLVDQNNKLSDVRHSEENGVAVLVAGSREFHEHFEGLKGKQRIEVTARDGDTLARIGARYGMSVGSMERVNRRSRSSKLIAGEQLIVYTEKSVSALGTDANPQALPALPPVSQN